MQRPDKQAARIKEARRSGRGEGMKALISQRILHAKSPFSSPDRNKADTPGGVRRKSEKDE